MKKILLLSLFLVTSAFYAQTSGITYQAILYNPNGEAIPGVNNANAPMANKNVCLQFSIIDVSAQTEYQETMSTTTDEFGMVNLIIGAGQQNGGYASTFQGILWNTNPKSLKVALSTSGTCANFTVISNQPFTAVPFALFALNTENTQAIQNNTAAIAALQSTVTNNASATTAALALKENAVNKSVDGTLVTNSDIKFPTEKAVKTYVDTKITTVNANTTALQTVVTNNATATTAALALKENAVNKSIDGTLVTNSDIKFPTEKAVKTYVDSNITAVNANTTALQTVVTNNATATTAALALKENAVNKSIDGTLVTNSDIKFPTEKAVKTYVDSNITAVNANTTALQTTVTNNATATTTALALKENAANKSIDGTLVTNSDIKFPTEKAVKTYVDTNITAVNANTTALQTVVTNNATATTAALALKENAINKSIDGTLVTNSDIKFPTEKAVKTYVDSNITAVNANTTALQTTVTNNATATTAALALKENAVNKSIDGTLVTNSDIKFPTEKAVKTYVDANITTVNANATALQTTVNTNATNATNAIAAVQTTVTNNATATTAALDLKENAANKSVDGTLVTNSDVKFPTEKAVKTYVDANITTVNANATALQNTVNDNTVIAMNLQMIVTNNAAATAAALDLKENAANKSIDGTLVTNSDIKFPTEKAVKTYVDNKIATGTATNVSGIVAVANGGTGSATQNFVDLTNNQTVAGVKTFNSDLVVNGVKVGKGAGGPTSATDISRNIAIGYDPLISNTGGIRNTAVGANVLGFNTTGSYNTGFGWRSLRDNVSGVFNTGIGDESLRGNTGDQNTGAGMQALATNISGSSNTALGFRADVTSGALTNATAIGSEAKVAASNTIQLGNTAVTNVKTSGAITAPIFASTPQALTPGATVSWNPASSLNASVTLNTNSTLSFTAAPTVGSYGSLVITQDATGGRTLTLPTGANKVIGSASTTSVALSTTAGAIDIVNFYYDGTNYYWNVGQGYGLAATAPTTSLSSGVTGTLPVANGGTGSTTATAAFDALSPMTAAGDMIYGSTSGTRTRLPKGTDGQILTLASGIPSWIAAASSGFVWKGAWNSSGSYVGDVDVVLDNTNGNSYLKIGNGNSGSNPAADPIRWQSISGKGFIWKGVWNSSASYVGDVDVVLDNANGNSYLKIGNGNSGSNPAADPIRWQSISGAGVPYTGATGAVNLGGYDLTVNGVKVGKGAGTNTSNTAIGVQTLNANTTGIDNSAVGYKSLLANTTGQQNTALGYQSLAANTTGTYNTATGYNALAANVSGYRSTANGNMALNQSTGSDNTAVGYYAGSGNTSGSSNTSMGNEALNGTTTGSNNVGIGSKVLNVNTSGSYNTAIGNEANVSANNLTNATAIGSRSSVDASNKVRIGDNNVTAIDVAGQLKVNANGTSNDFTFPTGRGASGQVLTTNGLGTSSWAAAAATGVPYSGATGAVNLGAYDLTVNGVKVGKGAGGPTSATDITRNIAIGYDPLISNTSGIRNTAVGANVLGFNTTGSYNTGFGWRSLRDNVTGIFNTGIGDESLRGNTGDQNTGAGMQALATNTTGSSNTGLGFQADVTSNALTNATAIGSEAKVSTSNTIQLGNTAVTNVNTYGSITANAAISTEITANLTINPSNAEQYKSKVLICNPSSAPITITFDAGLPVGFNCMVLQKSIDANKINIAGGSGVVMKNRNNYTATAGNYAMATVVHIGGDIIVSAGDMQ